MKQNTANQGERTDTLAAQGLSDYGSARDIAVKLGVHPRTVMNWAARGLLTKHVIGERVVRFSLAEVQQVLASAKVTANRNT